LVIDFKKLHKSKNPILNCQNGIFL